MWVAGLLAGLVIGWLFLPTPLAVCGIYQSEAMPAWVQAVGSVVAIFVAAGIPWWQQRIRTREEGKQLSIATLRLRSNLEALGRAAMEDAASIRNFSIEKGTATGIDMLVHTIVLTEVQPIEAYVDRVHNLEERIQAPIIELLQESDQFQIDRYKILDADNDHKFDTMRSYGGSLLNRLERISQLAFKASTAIRVVDEERKYPDIRARNYGGKP